jgi:hypothetical protein
MLKRLYRARRVSQSGLQLDFVDLRLRAKRNPEEIRRVLSDALQRISVARSGFGELVTSHLKVLAAAGVSKEVILPAARVYMCSFDGAERTNGHYLACLLIWAATSLRLSRDAAVRGAPLDEEAISRACYDAQIRFVKQFPDWEKWVETLSADRQ